MIYEKENLRNISFPLGGIGTGSVGLAGNGSLIDWEIFNRPNKQTFNGYSHFAVNVQAGEKSYTRVLQGDAVESLMGGRDDDPYRSVGHGPHRETMVAFPRFKNISFDGRFPVARINYLDDDFPVTAKLTAFNPFIPHDDFDSSLPVAMFEWEITNRFCEATSGTLCFSVRNPNSCSKNEYVEGNYKGIILKCADKTEDERGYSDLCIMTDHDDVSRQQYWYRGGWQDSVTVYWKNLVTGEMPSRTYDDAGSFDHATVAAKFSLEAGASVKLRFVLAWNVPNFYNYWSLSDVNDVWGKREHCKTATWKNYYATQFKNSFESADYVMGKFAELFEKTDAFSETIQGSTLPKSVIDAVSANISVLKTPTTVRLTDGSFWGWEGVNDRVGSCHGTCQHVWNYAYALPFLFPKLERSIRDLTAKYALGKDGKTTFRLQLPLEDNPGTHRACVDGQMGEVFKTYREWKISGDTEWLKERAPAVFSMLEYAWSKDNPDKWDADCDGVMEGRQHHTLDEELFGPSSWLEGMYLLALDCGSKIAAIVGDGEREKKYRELYENGKAWTNENLWNGRYFFQKVDVDDKEIVMRLNGERYWNSEAQEIKYQIADGCAIDQVLADYHAMLIGENGVFDDQKRKIALKTIFAENYKNMRDVTNMWRIYALNDESGTLMCSYPDGARVPVLPMPYVDEVWTGCEYAYASLLIANGMIEEGETVVKAVRDRFDGYKRNPWNEYECGNNYARSMSSYALLNAYSGLSYNAAEGYIGFNPVTTEGRFAWSALGAWGMVESHEKALSVKPVKSTLMLKRFGLPTNREVESVAVDGKNVPFVVNNGVVELGSVTVLDELRITLA